MEKTPYQMVLHWGNGFLGVSRIFNADGTCNNIWKTV